MANSKVSHIKSGGITYDIVGGLPMATVDSTSTSTVFTAQVPGVTEYYDGLTVYIFNNKVQTASGITLNINNLGAKTIWMSAYSANTRITTQWNANTGYLFTYNSARDSNEGGWDLQTGYNSDYNAYNIYTPYLQLKANGIIYRYQIVLQDSDTTVIPVNSVNNAPTNTSKTLTTAEFLPHGIIGYRATTSNVSSGTAVGSLYLQYLADLRYSFNKNQTLVQGKSVYIQCVPQSNGKLKLSGNDCLVQDLPTTADGYVYILLGHTYDTYRCMLTIYHPIFEYKNGALRLWTNADAGVQSVSLTGDVTGSGTSSIATTLASSGVTAGSYGSSAGATLAYSGKFTVPYVTFDAKGRATAASSKTFTLPAAPTTVANATTATNLASMSLTGDVTGSGTNTNTLATTLATSGVTAGSYGPSTGATLAHSGKFTVPYITFDAKGRATGASSITYTLPASGNTDTKVTQAAAITTSGEYPVLLAYSTATTATTNTVNKTSTLKYNPSTGALSATKFLGDGSGLTGISAGPSPSSTTPIVNGTATVGTETAYPRGDHVHPTDTTRVAKSGDTMTGQLVCQNNAHYEEKQARNIFIVLSGNTLPTGANGDVCLLY